jgi:hypothetical protein
VEPLDPSQIEQVSRFARHIRIEWRSRTTTSGMFKVYRVWVGTHVVERYISYDYPREHERVVEDLWSQAKSWILKTSNLASILHLQDIRAFINLPISKDRLFDMDQPDDNTTVH